MDKTAVINAINFFEMQLEKSNLRILKIILFGSWAFGKAMTNSDIDIIVLSEDFRNKDIFERAQITKEAEILTIKKFMIPLDVITLTPEEFESETSLMGEFVKEGEVVYG